MCTLIFQKKLIPNESKRETITERIKEKTGVTDDEIDYEIKKRKTALDWMLQNEIRGHKEVTKNILEFYSNSDRFYEKKRLVVENW